MTRLPHLALATGAMLLSGLALIGALTRRKNS
ncbi:hypothetical protein AAKU55_001179 [Oxalobacteraceae bacterium GrIS 1.11]